MVYTWDDAKAKDRRTKQMFEMFGNRAGHLSGWLDRLDYEVRIRLGTRVKRSNVSKL